MRCLTCNTDLIDIHYRDTNNSYILEKDNSEVMFSCDKSISDNNFRLSVRIMPSGAVGILRWFDSNTCKVYEIQKNVEVNIGDRVITSGFSKIYPPKLPVGTVSGVYDERGSYQKVINVSIQNDFESIQNVFIVLGEK